MASNETNAPMGAGQGKAFFDRADQVAETGNHDYAIDLYVQGLQREPDALDRGYKPMRDVALNRALKGGKPAGMIEKLKRSTSGKDPQTNLINAAFLLGKEPGNVQLMMAVLKNAQSLGYADVVKWMADIVLESQRLTKKQNKKPSKPVLLQLADAYREIEDFTHAVQTAQLALELEPDNDAIQALVNELQTRYTLQKGQYGQEGADFSKAVKDMDKQKELMESERAVQSKSYIEQQIEKTHRDYLAEPEQVGKVNAYVDALLKTEDEAYENTAIDVLRKAHEDLGAYQFKMKMGDIRIKQLKRRYQKLREQGQTDQANNIARQLLAYELEEFAERAVNYPTDLNLKYELGRRQLLAAKSDADRLDEAIGSLQQAQRDPRRRVQALHLLGQAFAQKGWDQEAVDTYHRALENEMSEERTKEVRYALGDAYERLGKLEDAQEQFSKVAQIDYNYRDTRQRLESIREKLSASSGE